MLAPEMVYNFISGHIINSLWGKKMELERNAKKQLCFKAPNRGYISGIADSSEARSLGFS